MDLTRIMVVAVDTHHHATHHLPKPSDCWKLVWRMDAQEMGKIQLFHLRSAELVKDEVAGLEWNYAIFFRRPDRTSDSMPRIGAGLPIIFRIVNVVDALRRVFNNLRTLYVDNIRAR